MKRTLSGDNLKVYSVLTFKSGSPLVARQGAVMREIYNMNHLFVPRIYWVGSTWYAMQTIHESLGPKVGKNRWHWNRASMLMQGYWYMPENWIYDDAPKFKTSLLIQYIDQQGWLKKLHMPTVREIQARYEGELPRLTHGDLTDENTVIQRDGTYKFIDWQAQRHPYIPPHKDVDYGKMLQSLIGWGRDAHLRRTSENSGQVRYLLKECPMAVFWCAVHFMRIKVRAKECWQEDVCDDNIEYLSWLSEKEVSI